MSVIILRAAICLAGKTRPRFSPELCCAEIDLPDTIPDKELIPQLAHPTKQSSSWGNQADLRSPKAMMTPFVTATKSPGKAQRNHWNRGAEKTLIMKTKNW
jgi:hypothetical protein